MANPNQDACLSNPDFAIICSFLDKYGTMLGLPDVPYNDLQEWIEDSRNVHPALVDLHCRMLRRIHKKLSNVSAERWERGIVKFCLRYSNVDAWEIERFGYKIAKVSTKLTLLKNLFESQFDCNLKFREKISDLTPEAMRFQPVGRDKNGLAYWYMLDKDLNLRIYREDLDDVDAETWELVCRNRDDLAKLIFNLESGTEISLAKTEGSDMSDGSFKSESASDANEDSRDSFRQRTPLGPSPLSFKVEPSETDSNLTDNKLQLKIKISKLEPDSPTKQLKDKFEKEKGSKLRKIKCKIKLENDAEGGNASDESNGEKEVKEEGNGDVSIVISDCSTKDKDIEDNGKTNVERGNEAEVEQMECDTNDEQCSSKLKNENLQDKSKSSDDNEVLGKDTCEEYSSSKPEKEVEEKVQDSKSPQSKNENELIETESIKTCQQSDSEHVVEGKLSDSEQAVKDKQPGSEQVVECKQSNSEQSVEGKQSDSEQAVKDKQPGSEQVVECKQSNSEQAVQGKQSDSEQAVEGKLSDSEQAVKDKPSDSEKAIEGKQSGSEQVVEGKRSDSEQTFEGKQSDSEGKQSDSEQAVKDKQPGSEKEVDNKQSDSEQGVEAKQSGNQHAIEEKESRDIEAVENRDEHKTIDKSEDNNVTDGASVKETDTNQIEQHETNVSKTSTDKSDEVGENTHDYGASKEDSESKTLKELDEKTVSSKMTAEEVKKDMREESKESHCNSSPEDIVKNSNDSEVLKKDTEGVTEQAEDSKDSSVGAEGDADESDDEDLFDDIIETAPDNSESISRGKDEVDGGDDDSGVVTDKKSEGQQQCLNTASGESASEVKDSSVESAKTISSVSSSKDDSRVDTVQTIRASSDESVSKDIDSQSDNCTLPVESQTDMDTAGGESQTQDNRQESIICNNPLQTTSETNSDMSAVRKAGKDDEKVEQIDEPSGTVLHEKESNAIADTESPAEIKNTLKEGLEDLGKNNDLNDEKTDESETRSSDHSLPQYQTKTSVKDNTQATEIKEKANESIEEQPSEATDGIHKCENENIDVHSDLKQEISDECKQVNVTTSSVQSKDGTSAIKLPVKMETEGSSESAEERKCDMNSTKDENDVEKDLSESPPPVEKLNSEKTSVKKDSMQTGSPQSDHEVCKDKDLSQDLETQPERISEKSAISEIVPVSDNLAISNKDKKLNTSSESKICSEDKEKTNVTNSAQDEKKEILEIGEQHEMKDKETHDSNAGDKERATAKEKEQLNLKSTKKEEESPSLQEKDQESPKSVEKGEESPNEKEMEEEECAEEYDNENEKKSSLTPSSIAQSVSQLKCEKNDESKGIITDTDQKKSVADVTIKEHEPSDKEMDIVEDESKSSETSVKSESKVTEHSEKDDDVGEIKENLEKEKNDEVSKEIKLSQKDEEVKEVTENSGKGIDEREGQKNDEKEKDVNEVIEENRKEKDINGEQAIEEKKTNDKDKNVADDSKEIEQSKSIMPSRKRKQEKPKPDSDSDSMTEEDEKKEVDEVVKPKQRGKRTKAARRRMTRSSKALKKNETEEEIEDEEEETEAIVNEKSESKVAENDDCDQKASGQEDDETEGVENKRPRRGRKAKVQVSTKKTTPQKKSVLATDSESEHKQIPEKVTRQRIKAQKRQADDSPDEIPVEPVSKKSKIKGRVSSRGRGKRREPVSENSSSSDTDDVPLCKIAGRGRGRGSKGRGSKSLPSKSLDSLSRKSTGPSKKKKFDSDDEDATTPTKPKTNKDQEKANDLDQSVNLSEDDMGRRRSLRVRNRKLRQKSPSPDYIPSELEWEQDWEEELDEEFSLKSKKKKKDAKFVEEEPTGRNAIRFAAKTKGKGISKKVEVIEEDETPCCKCLRSEQPEWILLCDKCDAGYHTACLRPPLMIIPQGDWFCPPCEHSKLIDSLQENLKDLDQSITKNKRMVRRKERLAYVSISLDNVLKEPELGAKPPRRKLPKYLKEESVSESSTSASGSSSSSSEAESESSDSEKQKKEKASKQKFIQRTCRTKKSISYKFEEFDEMIMGAIEEDLSIPKEPKPKKVKPPGISRGKDMSNILGVSDEEEKQKKPPKKRRPRLTELDEDVDDDDTDDYKLSSATEVSEASKSSDSDVDQVSEDSVEKKCKRKSRSRSKRKHNHYHYPRNRRRTGRYRNDFVVDSDFESGEDQRRRSGRKLRRKKVSYRELNSDDTEMEQTDESFHTSELDDSDFEMRKKKKKKEKERLRSGKRQRMNRFSSSESSEESSEEDSPRSKKKPPRKTARYEDDSSSTEVSEDEVHTKKGKKSRVLDSEDTESDSEGSSTEVSESEKKEKPVQKKRQELTSDSENDEEKQNEAEEDSEATENEDGWEEIDPDSEDENDENQSAMVTDKKQSGESKPLSSSEISQEMKVPSEIIPGSNENIKVAEPASDSAIDDSLTAEDSKKISESSFDMSPSKLSSDDTSPKKKRGRKPKLQTDNSDSAESPVKKRGRKPKIKTEPIDQDTAEESPVKKKCNRDTVYKQNDEQNPDSSDNANENVGKSDEKATDLSLSKPEGEQTAPAERKDDSPLTARNKQNAPVGVVKPEIRQGVIVENKQALDNRPIENRDGNVPMANPLQSMQEMAIGTQIMPQSGQSGFRPYPPSNFPGRNIENYSSQQSFSSFQQQGQFGPGPNRQFPGSMPFGGQGGMPQGQGTPSSGMIQGPISPSFSPNNQGPMSPNSFQQSNQYNMHQGPPGFYSGPQYGPQMGPGGPQGAFGGYGPQGFPQHGPSQGPNYPQGSFPPNYSPQGPHQGPYPNQSGPQGPFPPHPQGQSFQNMPYNYPHIPQPRHPAGFGPNQPQRHPQPPNSSGPMSPVQLTRPQPRHPVPSPNQQSPTARPGSAEAPPRRGFMMDSILKSAPEQSPAASQEQRGENPDEVDEIVKYVTHDKYFKEH